MQNSNSKYGFKTKIREMIFTAYFAGEIDMESVISRLQISIRHFFRLQYKFRSTNSLSHGLCGKPSNRSINPSIKQQVITLCKTRYHGFNYEHISDLLLERDDIKIKSSTVRKWLLAAKISLPRKRTPKKYTRREPRARFGEMLQLDGTFADFLGNGKMLCLMHLVDDATKTSLPMLFDSECTHSALHILYQWCLKYGVPQSIYCDKHGTYKVNDKQRLTIEEELEGKEVRLTRFAEVCERLGIELIYAHSPQAKGRVEKKHNLYKDRCIKELKLDGIKTKEDANVYLAQNHGFVNKLNAKFTIDPRDARTACVYLTPAELAKQFTINNTRTVRNDYTVQLNSVVYQLSRTAAVNARSKVLFKQYLNGSISIFAGSTKLEYQRIENYVKPELKEKAITDKPLKTIKYIAPKDHPFRQQYKPERKYRYQSTSTQLQQLGMHYS